VKAVDLQAIEIRDALGERGAAAATVALPEAASAITGRVDGVPGGHRIGMLFHHDRPAGRAAIGGLLDALDRPAPPRATLVFLSDGERESGSPHLAGYLDTLADRLAAEVWIVAGGPAAASIPVGDPGAAPVARVLAAWATAVPGAFPADPAPVVVYRRLGCPVIELPDADRDAWARFLGDLLHS